MFNKDKTPKRKSRKRRFLYTSLGLVGLLGVLVVLGLCLARMLPNVAITQIGRLTNTRIEVQSCRIDLDGSVRIQKLLVFPRDGNSNSSLILNAKTVYAKFDRRSLLRFKPRLSEIDIRDFVFDARYDLDNGHWNIGSLHINTPSGRDGQMPLVNLENGMLHYSKVAQEKEGAKKQVEIVTAVPVNAQFHLQEETEQGYQFVVKTGHIKRGQGQSKLEIFWKPGLAIMTGGISSKDLPFLERSLSIGNMAAQLKYDPNQTFHLDLHINDLYGPPVQQPESKERVFHSEVNPLAGLQAFFHRYQPSGNIDIQMDVRGNLSNLAASRISGGINCKNLAVRDRRFDYPMDRLTGRISFTNNTIEGSGLKAWHDQVPIHIDFTLEGKGKGKGSDSQYELHVKSEKMSLDQDLYKALDDRAKRAWDLVAPQGFAAIDYQRKKRSPSDTQRTLSVVLQNTSATYKGFPYPLKNLTGRIDLGEDHIALTDVISHTETLSIQLNGQIHNYRSVHPQHNLRVQATSLPLDNTLGQALSPQQRAAYRALQIQGTTHADVYIRTDPNDPKPASIYTNLSFQNASLLAPGIQSPFDHIYGQAVLSGKSITLQDLKGQYAGNPVSISGNITLDAESHPSAFDLAISSEGMQIADFLTALPERASQVIVNQLRPQGKIALSAQISQKDPKEPIQYEAVLDCLSGSARVQRFPYPLKIVTGKLVIDNKQCLIQGVRAVPDIKTPRGIDAGTVQVNGQIAFQDGSMHTANLQISGEGLPFDNNLAQALPERLRVPFAQLAPSGHFSLSPTDIKISVGADGIQHLDYLTTAHLNSADLKMGKTQVKLRGSIEAGGHFDSRDGMRQGFMGVHMDSLAVSQKEITDLRTLLTYNPKARLWQSNDLVGDLYDGRIVGQFDLQGTPEGAAQFKLQVGIANMNLHDFLQASADKNRAEKKQTTGIACGTISFAASLGPQSSRMGRCTLHIAEMQAGKVSPLAKVLASLGLTEARDHAFDNMRIDSYIQDDELLIETLDMSGNAIALQGSGTLHLPTGQLALALIARGNRLSLKEPSVLQSLTEELMGAVVQLEFTGHFSNPEFTTKALPILGNSFKLLGTPKE
jgi:hypothetical protein